MMRRLTSGGLGASVLIAGCATYAPPQAPERPQPQPTKQSKPTKQPKADKSLGQTQPLEREQVKTSGARIERAVQGQPRRANPPPKNIEATASEAVMSLVGSADQAMNELKPERASGLVERALRVAPRNPFLYQRLAAIRLVQKRPAQAIALARKSNALADRNPFVKRNNWALIAQARKMQGSKSAARQAKRRESKYQRLSRQYQTQ